MRVLGLVVAGMLALIAPIAGHAAPSGSSMSPPRRPNLRADYTSGDADLPRSLSGLHITACDPLRAQADRQPTTPHDCAQILNELDFAKGAAQAATDAAARLLDCLRLTVGALGCDWKTHG